mgnify:FL=1
MKNYCFITVRSSSSRLKKKCFLKFGSYTILDHIILRCINFNLIPVICTTQNKSDNKFKLYAKKYSIKIYQGSNKNKLLRWYECAKKFDLKYFHTVDADDPFFDHLNIKKSLKFLGKSDIIKPSSNSSSGAASEGYSFTIYGVEQLITINKLFNNKKDTEMIDNYVLNSSKLLKVKKLYNSKYITKKKYRLTLDYIEDYILLKKIYDKFGSFASRKKINKFLDKNLDLSKINYFRNKQWKFNQKKILSNSK